MTKRAASQDIPLDDRADDAGMDISQALLRRRSQRTFLDRPVPRRVVAELLHAGQGRLEGGRTAPSAGGQYPLQLWLAARHVEGIPVGVYRYRAERHTLEARGGDDILPALAAAAIGDQPWVAHAGAVLAIVADIPAMTVHFNDQPPVGRRGARYAAIEAGTVSQNIHLMATARAAGCVLVAGFDDDRVRQAFGLDAAMQPFALMCIGTIAA